MPYRTNPSAARPRPRARRLARVLAAPLAVFAVWILDAAAIHATTVEPLDLAELQRRAATVVRARCLDREEIPDDGPVPYTRYTFEVVEAIKGCRDARGAPVERITVRHGGTRSVSRRSDGLYVLPLRLGIPEYEPGVELILFLTKESQLGLCAPVGLGQGTFRILRVAGTERVVNAYRNRGLFPAPSDDDENGGDGPKAKDAETPIPTLEDGSFDLQDFLEHCRRTQREAAEGGTEPDSGQAAPPRQAALGERQAGDLGPRVVRRPAPSEVEDPEPVEAPGGSTPPERRVELRSSEEATR